MTNKLVNGVKSMHVNTLSRVRAKGGQNECFPWLFNVYMYAVMKGVKMRMIFLGEGRKCRLPGLLYANDLVLCCESAKPEGDDGTFFFRYVGREV